MSDSIYPSLNYYPTPVTRSTGDTVRTRTVDWDVLVRRVAGPEPAKDPIYFFSSGVVKYEYQDHNPFTE
jgi:hypothetical protein